jgi:hypothetical protein
MSQKILKVTFKSPKSIEELQQMSEVSLPKFRALREHGLLQKYYVNNPETGESGGIYVFESQEAVEAYLNGPIFPAISAVFDAGGSLRYEILDVSVKLYPEE